MQDSTKSLVSTALGHMINDGTLMVFPILYAILASTFGFSTLTIGSISALVNGCAIVASPFIGRRSDFNKNYIALLTMGLTVLSVALIGYSLLIGSIPANNPLLLLYLLIPFTLVAGLGASFYHPLGAAIIHQTWEPAIRGRAMGINGSIGAFGNLIFPIVAALLIGFSVLYVSFLGFLSVGILITIYFMLRSMTIGRSAKESPQNAKSNEILQPNTSQLNESKKENSLTKVAVSAVFFLIVLSFFRAFYTQSALQFMPTYLNAARGVPQAYLGYAIAPISIAGIISQPLFGQLGDRFGRKLMIGITQVGGALAVFLVVYSTGIVETEIFLAVFGLFQYTSFPLILALASELSPPGATTFTNSIVWGLGMIFGATVGPVVVGALSVQPTNLGFGFIVVASVGIAATVFLPLIGRKKTSA